MSTVGTLHEPGAWQRGNDRKPPFAIAFIGLGALIIVLIGVWATVRGEPELLPRSLLMGAFFSTLAAYVYSTRVRSRHHESHIALTTYRRTRATEIRYSRTQHLLFTANIASLAAWATAGALEFTFTGEPPDPTLVAVWGACAALSAGCLLLIAVGRVQRGRLLLTEAGVHQEGQWGKSFLAWDSATGIEPAHDGRSATITLPAPEGAAPEKTGSPGLHINTSVFDLDRALVYHLLRHYLENPQDRAELGTNASLERIRSRAFR
ncbi:hypothetical protein GCM10009854_29570 [Saccharopolyspora halophila]|uniref:Uncharacterized protein n=1 Tax=Saccharopolyspora halophila TaxID=405551 RepID=A0ABP5TDC1_9PSEU